MIRTFELQTFLAVPSISSDLKMAKQLESEDNLLMISDDDEEEEEVYEIDDEESDTEYETDDSESDPSFGVVEIDETQHRLSGLRIRKSKSRSKGESNFGEEDGMIVNPVKLDKEEEKTYEHVQRLIEAGELGKLKVDQCKIYLRKHGLRLTGKKETLLQRIKEHLEIINGEGEKKYPVSSFVLNCKGDACTGDVVLFQQTVYEMFNIASRSAIGPPCGTRIVAGRIVKESYGSAKQQHTFTIEVLWSKGEKPFPPLHPLLIKGRNLYRLKTLRQRWEDEGERQKVLMEKHSRGFLARSDREVRVREKEMRKMMRKNKEHIPKGKMNAKPPIQPQELGSSTVPVDAGIVQQSQYLGSTVAYKQPTYSHQQRDERPRNPSSRYINNIGSSSCSDDISGGGVHMPNFVRHLNLNQSYNPLGRNYQRKPFKSMNNHPTNPLRSQVQQLCRYYAQGKCHFGDNCRFLHE